MWDVSVFKPTLGNFREKYGISESKFMILGVAFGWGKRKGLDVLINAILNLKIKNNIELNICGRQDNNDYYKNMREITQEYAL